MIQYRLYGSDGAGGPIDYGTILATVSGLTWDTPALAAPSDNLFGVRAFDSVSGMEETNADARVRIVIDADGVDVSARPNAPTALRAIPKAHGAAQVLWQYNPGGQGGAPAGFHVYVGTPTPDFATAAATVAYVPRRPAFRANLSGLSDGVTYQVVVRAYNAAAEEPNETAFSFTASTAGPLPVADLTGSAVH